MQRERIFECLRSYSTSPAPNPDTPLVFSHFLFVSRRRMCLCLKESRAWNIHSFKCVCVCVHPKLFPLVYSSRAKCQGNPLPAHDHQLPVALYPRPQHYPSHDNQIGYGVTANIAASHAAARGSIPRIRVLFFAQPPRATLTLPLRVQAYLTNKH